PNIAGWIAETDEIIRLFHPRKDEWSTHFEWQGPLLIGRTPIGSVTIDVLRINHPDAMSVRQALSDL
ncbi:MAG: HNH endonuclease, partial [Planctomycetota bacterium]